MTETVARLEKWADVLAYIADPDFNLETWDHCAAGHFCKDEFAIKNGMSQFMGEPVFAGEHGGEAIARFFGITRRQAGAIISPSYYPQGETIGARGRALAIQRIKALAEHYRSGAPLPQQSQRIVPTDISYLLRQSPLLTLFETA